MQRFLPGVVKRELRTIWSRFVEWLREWTKPDNHGLVGGVVADGTRSKSQLMLENALLRQQVIVLDRQVKRPVLSWRERGIMVLLASKLGNWRAAVLIVQPDTVVRWHRDIFRLVWRRKSQPKQQGGRPPLPGRVVHLIRRLARENPLWGAERVRGEMLKLKMGVAKSSVQKYTQDLRRAGPSGQNWGTFLRNHASEIWACDFLQTYDALFRTVFVFVIIELESRRVVYVNVTRHPTDAWVAQQLREATPFGERPRFLIRDNDKKFGEQFQDVVDGTDIELLKTPVEAPRAILFVGTVGWPPEKVPSETWAYDLNTDTWTNLEPSTAPRPLLGARMVYDAESDRMILFGGIDSMVFATQGSIAYTNETWAYDFDSNTWTQMDPEISPPGVNYQPMAYDAKADRVILIGSNAYEITDDTWVYDYNTDTWEVRQTDESPKHRQYCAMFYAAEVGQTILFGEGEPLLSNDTWTYDFATNTWTELTPEAPPSPRGWHAAAYSSATEQAIVFGGGERRDGWAMETWVYDPAANTWTQVGP